MSSHEMALSHKNRYQAQWEFAQGISDVDTTPPNLQIARSNLCNFKCVYCPDHWEGNQIPRTKNDGATWERLVRLIPRSSWLAFHGVSEFMIDPEFFNIVQQCADAGAGLSLNTNASVCTPRHLELLASYPAAISVNFSLDACTPETFLRIRGKEYWKILDNIKRYMVAFERRRHATWTSLSFVITKSSVHEMVPMVYLGKALKVNQVKYYRLHEYDSFDWNVNSKDGGVFSYRSECTGKFGEEYNHQLELTRRAAEIVDLSVILPAPWSAEQAG